MYTLNDIESLTYQFDLDPEVSDIRDGSQYVAWIHYDVTIKMKNGTILEASSNSWISDDDFDNEAFWAITNFINEKECEIWDSITINYNKELLEKKEASAKVFGGRR